MQPVEIATIYLVEMSASFLCGVGLAYLCLRRKTDRKTRLDRLWCWIWYGHSHVPDSQKVDKCNYCGKQLK